MRGGVVCDLSRSTNERCDWAPSAFPYTGVPIPRRPHTQASPSASPYANHRRSTDVCGGSSFTSTLTAGAAAPSVGTAGAAAPSVGNKTGRKASKPSKPHPTGKPPSIRSRSVQGQHISRAFNRGCKHLGQCSTPSSPIVGLLPQWPHSFRRLQGHIMLQCMHLSTPYGGPALSPSISNPSRISITLSPSAVSPPVTACG